MSRLVRIAKGKDGLEVRLWWCIACDEYHQDGGKWEFNGDPEKPTFSPSFLLHETPTHKRCHTFIRNGKIEYLGDCTHDYAGKTVDMIEGRY